MIRFFLLVIYFICGLCKINTTENRSIIVNRDLHSKTSRVLNFISGNYKDVSLAINKDNVITGVYEYYDNWDEIHKEYLNINVFYFTGKANQDTVAIKADWPGNRQQLKGKIYSYKEKGFNAIKILLNKQPLGYNDADFTSKLGVSMSLDKPKDWIEVRMVKTSKARLFNLPDSSTIRKGYLVKNDIVKILTKNASWDKIEYNPKNDKNQSTILWIRDEDLYVIDPAKW